MNKIDYTANFINRLKEHTGNHIIDIKNIRTFFRGAHFHDSPILTVNGHLFKGQLFRAINLESFEFINCTFEHCSFPEVVFDHCIFTNVKFIDCSFTNSKFLDCLFEQTYIIGGQINDVLFWDCGFSQSLFENCSDNSLINFDGGSYNDLSFNNCKLYNLRLSQFPEKTRTNLNFNETTLEGCSFIQVNFSNSAFNKCTLNSTKFNNCKLTLITFTECKAQDEQYCSADFHTILDSDISPDSLSNNFGINEP
ncbi:MAG: pentapeptide repeat-containing protein, partial [Bacteroidia bacterium]|nr:pentapeptide repeat-containing protein [Bacteroidia bacterium]